MRNKTWEYLKRILSSRNRNKTQRRLPSHVRNSWGPGQLWRTNKGESIRRKSARRSRAGCCGALQGILRLDWEPLDGFEQRNDMKVCILETQMVTSD